MTHRVDGFDLKFTSRRSWKAERRAYGRLIDIVPVTWTKGRRRDEWSNEIFLKVWYRDDAERAAMSSQRSLSLSRCIAKDYQTFPHAFQEFRGLFEVAATGVAFDDGSIETRVLRRVRAQ